MEASKIMTKRLYVGNLPFSMSEEDLRQVFEKDGRQLSDVKLITDRQTGRSRGFGFVEFSDDAQAQSAIEALNGKEINGRALVVNEARQKDNSSQGGGGRRGSFTKRRY